MIGEDLKARSAVDLLHVPFQGMGPVITSVIGGQVDIAFLPLAGQTVGLIRDGRVKALAVTGPTRNRQLPSVASVDESTGLAGFHHSIWLGIFAPASLPDAIAAALNTAIGVAIAGPAFQRFAAENGTAVPEPALSLEQATRFYASETQKFQKLARSVKLEPS